MKTASMHDSWWHEKEEELIVQWPSSCTHEEACTLAGRMSGAVAAAASAEKQLVLDFANVQQVSAAIIGQLLLLKQKAQRPGVHLRMVNVSANLWPLFEISQLHTVFGIDEQSSGTPLP